MDLTLRLTEPIQCAGQKRHWFTCERRTCAIQLLLGHPKLESTVRYPSIDVDDAIAISEQTEVLIHPIHDVSDHFRGGCLLYTKVDN